MELYTPISIKKILKRRKLNTWCNILSVFLLKTFMTLVDSILVTNQTETSQIETSQVETSQSR